MARSSRNPSNNRRSAGTSRPADRGPGPRGPRREPDTDRDGRDDRPDRDDRPRPDRPRAPHTPGAGPNLSVVQARNVAICAFDVLRHVLNTRLPADRELATFFRKNKQCGSRDRRLIAEALYSTFRWWGWLAPRGRDLDTLWKLDCHDAADQPAWLRVLLAAHLLDATGDPHPIALRWRDMLQTLGENIRHIDGVADRPLVARGDYIAHLLDLPQRNWRDLAPQWFFQNLPLPHDQQLSLIEDLQSRPPIWLRLQTGPLDDVLRDLQAAGLQPQVHPLIPTAICLPSARVNLFELPTFRDGHFEVQDLASQCIGLACQAQPGQRWWDVCAGAGGKALQLGAMMQGKGVVIATDVREWKLEDLKKRARRSQLHNITTRRFTGRGIPAKAPNFDGVLVDAPCTCTGTWRRNPDARWTSQATDIAEMAELQYEILCNAATGVKPGGALVYATCSVTAAESEEVVTRFLTDHPHFTLDPLTHPITGATDTPWYRIWPNQANCDATFVARMKLAEQPPK